MKLLGCLQACREACSRVMHHGAARVQFMCRHLAWSGPGPRLGELGAAEGDVARGSVQRADALLQRQQALVDLRALQPRLPARVHAAGQTWGVTTTRGRLQALTILQVTHAHPRSSAILGQYAPASLLGSARAACGCILLLEARPLKLPQLLTSIKLPQSLECNRSMVDGAPIVVVGVGAALAAGQVDERDLADLAPALALAPPFQRKLRACLGFCPQTCKSWKVPELAAQCETRILAF